MTQKDCAMKERNSSRNLILLNNKTWIDNEWGGGGTGGRRRGDAEW